jgi:hypothetical protein
MNDEGGADAHSLANFEKTIHLQAMHPNRHPKKIHEGSGIAKTPPCDKKILVRPKVWTFEVARNWLCLEVPGPSVSAS